VTIETGMLWEVICVRSLSHWLEVVWMLLGKWKVSNYQIG